MHVLLPRSLSLSLYLLPLSKVSIMSCNLPPFFLMNPLFSLPIYYYYRALMRRPSQHLASFPCVTIVHIVLYLPPSLSLCLYHFIVPLSPLSSPFVFFLLHVHHIPHAAKPTHTTHHIILVIIQLSHPLLVHGLPNHFLHIIIPLIVHILH